MKKLTIEDFLNKAHSIYGNRFDYSKAVYTNAKEKIKIRCIKHNYWFKQTSNSHFNGIGCGHCISELKRKIFSLDFEEFKERIIKVLGNNIGFDKANYINQRTKITLTCNIHNEDFTKVPYLILKGIGCNKCSTEKLNKKRSREYLKIINEYVIKLKGKCLSDYYENNIKLLIFECENGHIFKESWSDVKNVLRWCPKCSKNKYIGEDLARQMLENALQIKLPSMFIKKLNGLQLDGYNKKEKIAFEYQGYQHSKRSSHFHKTQEQFKSQIKRDKIKKSLCKKNGIILIEIEQFKIIRRNKIQDCYNNILNKLDNSGLTYSEKSFEIDLYDLFRNKDSSSYIKAKKIVEKRGGNIEGYIGSESYHIYYCPNNHKVSTRTLGVIIKSSASCPVCEDEEMLLDLKNRVEKRGGKLLEKKWKGNNENYKWVCDKGHNIISKAAILKKGHWCIKCQYEEKKIKLSDTNLKSLFSDIRSGKYYQKELPIKYGISDIVYRRILKENKIIPNYKPQNRKVQNISNKVKGSILQIDPKTYKVINEYPYLESVKYDENNYFLPANIRKQMKKNRKAYGFYWCYKKDFEKFKKRKKARPID